MRFEVLCFFALGVLTVSSTSTVAAKKEQERLFVSASSITFSTFTLIKSTTVLTTTMTRTTTCTTSTAFLSTCTTGRRRRGLFYDESKDQDRHRRAGLFHDVNEAENKDGTVFLPADNK